MSFFSLRRVCVLTALLVPAGASAEEPSRFPLSRAAPEDVFIFVAARHNPKRAFLDEYWQRVCDEFHRRKVLDAVWSVIEKNVPDDHLDQVEEFTERAKKLMRGVRWGELFGGDSLYVGRASFPVWEHLFLLRNRNSGLREDYAGLRAILEEIVELTGHELELKEWKYAGATLCSLAFGDAPISITIGLRGDVLALSMGDALLKDALDLLAGSGGKPALVESARFREAFAALPPAEDSMVFFDVAGLMTGLRRTMDAVAGQVQRQSPPDSAEEPSDEDADADGEARKMLALIGDLLNDLSIIDYSAESERTEGYRTITDGLTTLASGAKQRAAYRVFVTPQRIDRFDRFVPKEATGYSVDTGCDLVALYDWIVSVIERTGGEGRAALARWEAIQEEHSLRLRDDVLRCFEGPIVTVTLPGRAVGSDDWVMLVTVRDTRQVRRLVRRGLDGIDGLLGERQQLVRKKIEIDGSEGFNEVSHPMMMMFQMPPIVWGTNEGYFIVSSNRKAVSRCLKTAAGEAPSIRESERFGKEGVVLKGEVVSARFTDTSRSAEEYQAALAGVTMGLGMVTAFAPIPDEGGGRVFKALPDILGKLVPVVGKLDFFQSESSMTTFDGKVWRTRSVVNYKDPATVRRADQEEEDEIDNDSAARRPAEERRDRPRAGKAKQPSPPDDADDADEPDDD